jgi:predicted lipoprotein with Yx(FWY)xxD motif
MLVRPALLAVLALALLPAGAMAAAKVGTADSRFGTILVDGRGHTLYGVTKDGRGPSRCYGSCAKAWPPFYANGTPTAIGGARGSYLGTTRRKGGRRQVTYRGRPLYFYVGERQAGQILCQDVYEFGGFWRILRTNGALVS